MSGRRHEQSTDIRPDDATESVRFRCLYITAALCPDHGLGVLDQQSAEFW
jgi:hypothetical protein